MGFLDEFKQFAMRGNVVDLAVGFTVGAAFTTVARSLVDDIIMPPVGYLLGNADFSDLFLVLRPGAAGAGPYRTLAEAQAAGAVTWNYGRFVNSIITFLIVALAMFILIRLFNRLSDRFDAEEAAEAEAAMTAPDSKACPYCLSTIPYGATRCPHCTSHLDATVQATAARDAVS